MNHITDLPAIFGSDVFNEATMRDRLSPEVFQAWKTCIETGTPLELTVANHIAEAMKVWATEKGATHFTHWFQPMTGITAEKHDSFLTPVGEGRIIMEFSGKELVRGEPDASSFPSGGLRATFEARGYTAWDPTSYAFVKDGSLFIPTCFFSYTGAALDKKTPLLRSIDEVSREAIRILRLFGDTTTRRVITCVGPEQEYFLIPRDLYAQRPDLRLTGRTLFGAPSPKGQELDDHYFGTDYNGPTKGYMRVGVDVLPNIPKDTTDRNRTSPVAFTGNKFEFRMIGAAQSVSDPNIVLNTIMAEELGQFADELEKAADFDMALHDLVVREFRLHKRIIFDGNGYSDEWKKEAVRRGLSNHATTPEAMDSFLSQKNIDLVTKHGIFTEQEFRARHEIQLESYIKNVNIEALTSIDMIRHQILPAAMKYAAALTDSMQKKYSMGIAHGAERKLVQRLSAACDSLYDCCEKLVADLKQIPTETSAAAKYYGTVILADMRAAREQADILEALTDKSCWPYPTYSDLLFY